MTGIRTARRARQNPDIDAEIEAMRARENAQTLLNAGCSPVDNPYATRKKFTPPASVREVDITDVKRVLHYTPRTSKGPLVGRILVVPIFVEGKLSTAELIDETGNKYSLKGGKKTGGCLTTVDHLPDADWFGDLTFVVGEGLATTVSAATASGHIGVTVFSCVNLLAVGKMLRERYPEAKIIFVADLGIGVEKCNEAARAVGGLVAIPDFGIDRPEGAKDLNDLFCQLGPEAAKACIDGAAPPPPVVRDLADKDDAEGLTQSQVLMTIAHDQCDLYRGVDDAEAYATTPDGATHLVHSKGCRMFLRQQIVGINGKAPSSTAMQEAIDTIEAVVVGAKATRAVAIRVGEEAGKAYIDLGTDDHKIVEVTSDGWQIVPYSATALRFRRSPSMRELPMPTMGGVVDDLRQFINVDDDGWRLVVAWIVHSLQKHGPHPILTVQGERGAAKTTCAKMVRRLTDPSIAEVRSMPRDESQVFVAVSGSRILAYDNLSGMPMWLSDVFCGLATGTAQTKRALFTDNEEHIVVALCPLIVNGIDELLSRPDLASRALSITLPVIRDENRREESELWTDFETARPRIFGALLTTLSKVLATIKDVRLPSPPRMADFARFGVAVERVLGWPDGSFLNAYESSQRDSATSTMESNLVALAVQRLMSGDTTYVKLSATDLLSRLAAKMTEDQLHSRTWPQNATALGNQLRRVAPALREFGITAAQGKTHGDRFWELTRDVGAPGGTRGHQTGFSEVPCFTGEGAVGAVGAALSHLESKREREEEGKGAVGAEKHGLDTWGNRVPPTAPGATNRPPPDARALLNHCVRVRPDSSVADADVEALGAYFASLDSEKAIEAELRLWPWWKGTTTPTVGAFLQTEGKPRP